MLFQFIKGSGKVAGLLDEKKLVIWWKIRPNHYQSVLFTSNTSLAETFKTGQLIQVVSVSDCRDSILQGTP